MENKCYWLPSLVYLSDCNGDWNKYEEKLYKIFENDFINNHPYFQGKKVIPRRHPMYNGKVESYFHITCGHYKNIEGRQPDIGRCERIKYPSSFINNAICSCKTNCDDYIIWKKNTKNIIDTHYY